MTQSLDPGRCLSCGSMAIEVQSVDVNGVTREGWVCDDCGFVMFTPMSIVKKEERDEN